MKKALIAAIAVMAAGTPLWGEYLNWQIGKNTIPFTFATLVGGGETLDYVVGSENTLATGFSAPVLTALTADTASYWYWVELYTYENNTETKVGQSAAVSYSDLKSAKTVYQDKVPGGGATPYSFSDFTLAPEPTSLGLMLLGLAGLALRRKAG